MSSFVEHEQKSKKTTHPALDGGHLSFADGDIILRSSDKVNFQVDSVVLKRSSRFFENLFQLPRPKAGEQCPPEVEILPVDENSQVLDMLLRALYSYQTTTPSDPFTQSDIHALFRAVDKFDITSSGITTLVDQKISQRPALAAWALAVTYHRPAARKSAFMRLVREYKADSVFADDVPELDAISSRTFSRLQRLHAAAMREAKGLLALLESRHPFRDPCPHEGPYGRKITEGFHRLAGELGDPEGGIYDNPVPFDQVTDFSEASLLSRHNCTACLVHFAKHDAIRRRIELREAAEVAIALYASEESGLAGM